jgi:predicted TIM-barrel fold metal-dependent hydrolase
MPSLWRAATTPSRSWSAMDEEGLRCGGLVRTFPLHCDDSLEAEYATIYARRGITGWRIFAKRTPGRLRPSALITLHDVDMAVDETRRAITELGAIWLCLVPEPPTDGTSHDRYYDPVWREAEKLRVPICFHPAAARTRIRPCTASRVTPMKRF